MSFKKVKVLALTLALSLLVGCSTSSSSRGNTTEKVLVYGSNDYTSINPAIYEHGEINSLIFNGLTSRDKDNKVVPALAEKWEIDNEINTYTFKLRDDVKWHDGESFTSEDVKFTFDMIMNPDNNSEIASNYEEIEKIEVIDKTTVRFVLNAKNVAMLDYLAVGILPKHILEGKDIVTCDFNQNPVGTGPYKLEKWDTGQSITLVKNKQYFRKNPSIDKIVFKIVNDSKAKVVQLKSGELDLAQVTPKDISTFEGNSDYIINKMKTADYRGVLYNFNSKIFKENKELPNALSYAIDRGAIVQSILLGYGDVAYSPLQMGPYNNPDIEKFQYSTAKAKEELEKSGWKLASDNIYEKNGTKLSFEIVVGEGDQVRLDMANVVAQQLKEIGVDTKVVVKAKVDWANQDAYLIGWGSPFDPDDHTYKVFGTDKGSNFSAYSNTKIDDLLKVARETDVESERLKYYKEFQEELTKNMPYTFLAYIDAIYIAKSSVQGITPETVLGHHGVGIFWNVEDWDIAK